MRYTNPRFTYVLTYNIIISCKTDVKLQHLPHFSGENLQFPEFWEFLYYTMCLE